MNDDTSSQRNKVESNDRNTGDRGDGSNRSLNRRVFVGGSLLALAGGLPSAASAATSSDATAVSSGAWSEPSTWDGGAVPAAGDSVAIQEGVTVTLGSETPRLDRVNVHGTLGFDPDTDSHLCADTLVGAPGSSIVMGTSDRPIAADAEARVTFVDAGAVDNSNPDAFEQGRGLLVSGDFTVHGAAKTSWTTLASHPTAGDDVVELAETPTNWQVGDQLVVPGVYPDANEDEERTVAAVDESTNAVELDAALEFDHAPPKSGLDSYALNLTRNVVFASESTDLDRRGHGMVMSTATDVRYAAFEDMGRTDKSRPVSDPVRGSSPEDANVRARYPFHFHHTGIGADPHHVVGCVANGAPGWGFVNHHAHANITDCVTYDVLGAGFVAEGGNERGSFERNFALRSAGSGETVDSRAAGDHGGDPAIDDFGHAGHGFWMQSPLVEVTDNVAAGHRHQAFVWWLRPLLEGDLAEGSSIEDSRVTFWPNLPVEYADIDRPLWEAIQEGRFSSDEKDALMVDTGKIPSTFANVAPIGGNTAFAAAGGVDFSRHDFKWKHERFSDFTVIDEMTVYHVGKFVDDDGEVHAPNLPRHRAPGHQGRGGGTGVAFRYTSNVRLTNSTLIGPGLDDTVGVPFHDYRWTTVVENSIVEGWDWGVDTGEHRMSWVRNNAFANNAHDVNWSFDNAGPGVFDGNDLQSVRFDFARRNQKAPEIFEFDQDRGVRIDGRTAYVEESAADSVPFPDQDSLGGINNLDDVFPVSEDELVGMTNAEMQDEFGVSIGGALLPSDAVSEPWLTGALVDPAGGRDPPGSVYVDSTTTESTGGFEVVSDPDAANGECLRCTGSSSPKDDPASFSFDCAAGTYTVQGRIRPDSWNGDTVHVRVDGGTWYDAEKLKSPVGFRWHEAEPNGGDPYEWELSEGTHTLEVACGNDDVLVDQLFVTSNAAVLGGHGDASTVTEASFGVSTESPTVDGATSATLNGSLNDLGGASSADCGFEWRQVGASEWNATAADTLSATDSFSATVDGLEEGVDYEYRAVGEASDGDADTGSAVTFATTDEPPAVTTGSASSVDAESASLDGSLDGLGNADAVDVYFEYRETGASSWSTTATETRSSTGSFSADLTGLSSGTEYEFRAVGDGSDGDSDGGEAVSFSTDSQTSDSAPTIDSYSVSEAGSPNPHAEITADWTVSDADGDLESVEVAVVGSSGARVDAATTDASGESASGTDRFRVKHARGRTFDVALTVTDAAGKQSSATRTVTE